MDVHEGADFASRFYFWRLSNEERTRSTRGALPHAARVHGHAGVAQLHVPRDRWSALGSACRSITTTTAPRHRCCLHRRQQPRGGGSGGEGSSPRAVALPPIQQQKGQEEQQHQEQRWNQQRGAGGGGGEDERIGGGVALHGQRDVAGAPGGGQRLRDALEETSSACAVASSSASERFDESLWLFAGRRAPFFSHVDYVLPAQRCAVRSSPWMPPTRGSS